MARGLLVFARDATLLLAAAAVTVAALLYIAGFAFQPNQAGASGPDFNIAIGLILTAVTVILAALALVLALAAAVGNAQLKSAVERTAKTEASEVAREVAGCVAARTATAAAERGLETSPEGDDFKQAILKEKEDGNGN